MQRRSAVLLGVLVVLLLPPGFSALAADGGSTAPVTTPEGFDSSAFHITVHENGSARWTIQHARPLPNESEKETFQEYASRFNTEDTRLERQFRNETRLLVANVSDRIGREMTARNFNHRASIRELGGTRGVVELSFTWTTFAKVGEDTVVVGDIFEGGLYIFENQRLIVGHGPNLRFVEARPEPTSMSVEGNLTQSDTVTWQGERQFNDNRPLVRLAEPGLAQTMVDGSDGPGADGGDTDGGTAGDGGDGGPTANPDRSGSNGVGMAVIGLLLVVLLGVGFGAAWAADALPTEWRTDESGGRGSTASEVGSVGSGTESPPEPGVTEEEMLSDEDRVLGLLEENEGRMKQVNIVDETDWSKSKVSMLLSEMEDDGKISKLRVGRENIISLAGQEPDAAGSPFEED
jgi:hypothetical protein